MLNQAIRTRADLYAMIDRQLIVSIPYITTHAETLRKKKKTVSTSVVLAIAAVTGLLILFFVLPPIDILTDKVLNALAR